MTTAVPELQSGDRLTRTEFERRYRAMTTVKKAELVEGVVYVASPVRHEQHGGPHADLMLWLGLYRMSTPGVVASDNATVRLDLDNEPQPDALLRIASDRGGRSTIEDGFITGPPELVAEIAASSASYDLHDKLTAYRRNGVQEYLVWRVLEAELDWFVLQEGSYVPLEPSDGVCQSGVFPGLWLDTAALIRGDMGRVNEVLQAGLATSAHAVFVQRLTS